MALKTNQSHFKTLQPSPEKETASKSILLQFEDYLLLTMAHLRRKEQVVSKILGYYYTDAELQQPACKIVTRSGTSLDESYAKWMFRSLNKEELMHWLQAAKAAATEEEFRSLLQVTEAELQPGLQSLLEHLLSADLVAA